MNDEERKIRAILFPDEVEEEEKEFVPLLDGENETIEQIRLQIKNEIKYEKQIAQEKKLMHEEFEERYNPFLKGIVLLNSLFIFVCLIFAWFVVVIAFKGKSSSWLWCPFLTVLIVFNSKYILVKSIPPDRAARKAVLISVFASLCFVGIFESIKYIIKLY